MELIKLEAAQVDIDEIPHHGISVPCMRSEICLSELSSSATCRLCLKTKYVITDTYSAIFMLHFIYTLSENYYCHYY